MNQNATSRLQTNAPPRVNAVFDVEPTNRCNARCIMCPRDKTPKQGNMDKETFRQVVRRAVEYGRVESFVLGGLGESMVHPEIVSFVGMAAEAGLKPSMITNGSLLTKEKSQALVDAGLKNINLSIGGITKETYEKVHVGLKFERVYENAMRFLEIAAGKATMNVQISPTDFSIHEAERIAAFWRGKGAQFCFIFPFASSRGGALSADAMEKHCQKSRIDEPPRGCINIEELFRPTSTDGKIMHARAPFVCYPKDRVTFVSWQGNYHLCCNDYEKKHVIGNVHEMSVDEAYDSKASITRGNNAFCKQCDFTGGDLPCRDLRFYLNAARYLASSAILRTLKRSRVDVLPKAAQF